MSRRDSYRHIEAFVEQQEIIWMGDDALRQPVTVDADRRERDTRAGCLQAPGQPGARPRLPTPLVEAEHAGRLSDGRKEQR